MKTRFRRSVTVLVIAMVASALAGGLAAPAMAGDTVTIAATPDAPVLSATPVFAGVHLSWAPPSDNGNPITNYKIYRSTSTGTETFIADAGNVTTYDDPALLTDGTEYFYQVTAENTDGESLLSNEASAVPLTGIPDAPVLTASPVVAGVHLSWTTPSGNGSPITNYKIYRSTTTGTETFLQQVGTVTTFDDTPLATDGTEFFYEVSAVTGIQEGALSNEASAVPVTGIPDAPVLTATPILNGVHLSWTTPSGNGSPITNYKIYRSTTTGTETFLVQVGTVTTFDDTPLANDGTEFFYEVSAVTSVQEGPKSNEDSAIPTPDPSGEFTSLIPARVLDTRGDPTIVCAANAGLEKLGGDASMDVRVAGCGGVPLTGVSAVVVNVTVTEPTDDSFLTVWPTDIAKPDISNLNFLPGQTVPNLVTVALGVGGDLSVYNKRGASDVIFDVVGYYSDATGTQGGRSHGINPSRFFDTRDGEGGVPVGQLGADGVLQFKVTGKNSVPATGVTAVVMNVTVVGATTSSFLTVYPDDVTRPNASNLNFVSASPIPNLVVVHVPASGLVDFYNKRGFTHVLADVVGYYDGDETTDGGRFIPITPVRRIDTRISSPFPAPGKVGAGFSLLTRLPGTVGLPATGIGSVVLNVTATEPAADGFLTVYPPDVPLPFVSNLNFVAGQTVPNLVMVKLSAGPPPITGATGAGWLGFYNPYGATHVIVDIFGWFTASSPGVTGASVDATEVGDTSALITQP